MNNSKFVYILLFVFFGLGLSAQQDDFQSWNGISLRYKINKKYTVGASYQIRLKQNAGYLEDHVTLAYARYKVNKIIMLKGAYRYLINNNVKKGYLSEQRIYGDIEFSYEWKRIEFYFRERYQYDYSNLFSDSFKYYNFHHLRHKLGCSYNIKKTSLTPYISYELYQSLNNYIDNGIDKYRITAGFSTKLTDHLYFEMYYRFQNRNNYISTNLNSYILGSELKFRF